LYYAELIGGAVALAKYRKIGELDQKNQTVNHIESALKHWINYAGTLDSQYNKMVICFNGLFDWDARIEEVKNDILIAKNEVK